MNVFRKKEKKKDDDGDDDKINKYRIQIESQRTLNNNIEV